MQRWIINHRIAKDKDTLTKCDVTTTGSVIFLYLKSMVDEVNENSKETQTDFVSEIRIPSNYTPIPFPRGYQDQNYLNIEASDTGYMQSVGHIQMRQSKISYWLNILSSL